MVYKLVIAAFLLVGCAAPRHWTKEEKMWLAGSCAAAIADMTTTIENLSDGGWEINPVMGKHPTSERVVLTMSLVQGLFIIFAHYFDDYREWLIKTKTCINTGFVLHNVKIRE